MKKCSNSNHTKMQFKTKTIYLDCMCMCVKLEQNTEKN